MNSCKFSKSNQLGGEAGPKLTSDLNHIPPSVGSQSWQGSNWSLHSLQLALSTPVVLSQPTRVAVNILCCSAGGDDRDEKTLIDDFWKLRDNRLQVSVA